MYSIIWQDDRQYRWDSIERELREGQQRGRGPTTGYSLGGSLSILFNIIQHVYKNVPPHVSGCTKYLPVAQNKNHTLQHRCWKIGETLYPEHIHTWSAVFCFFALEVLKNLTNSENTCWLFFLFHLNKWLTNCSSPNHTTLHHEFLSSNIWTDFLFSLKMQTAPSNSACFICWSW